MTDARSRTPQEYLRSTWRGWGRGRRLLVATIGALVVLAVGAISAAALVGLPFIPTSNTNVATGNSASTGANGASTGDAGISQAIPTVEDFAAGAEGEATLMAAGQGADPVEGESFTHPSGTEVVTGSQYSGGKALKITSGQALPIKKEVTITEASHVLVRARAGQTGGSPTLTIRVNGNNAGTRRITSSTLSDYLYAGITLQPGTYTLGLKGGDLAEGRYVFVDVLRFPAVNKPPVGADDSATVEEDSGATTIDVLANDTDPDGDTLTVTANTSPAHGTLSRSGGTFTYTPQGNFNGPDTFTYTISDGNGGTDTGTVSITVTPVNDPPVTVNDPYSVNEDGTLTKDAAAGVLSNDTDADGDTFTAAKVEGSGPAHGTLLFDADGSFTYTPEADYNGPDSFEYTVSDSNGATATATVSITVDPVNDAPVATDDSASVAEGGTVNANVLPNDTDAEGDVLSAVLVSGPANASSFTLNPDGSFDYVHNGGETTTDSFTYKANDGALDSNVATVTITVASVNDAPVANDDPTIAGDPNYTTDEDTALSVAVASGVLSNDTDADGDSLNATLVSGPTHAANFTLNPDGSFDYTPIADFNGTDTFTYKASDGTADSNVATVTITVGPINDAPSFELGADQTVVNTDGAQTVEGFATNIKAGPSDESGQTLTFTVTNSDNSLFSEQPSIDEQTGDLTYTPAENASGTAVVSVTLMDDGGTEGGGEDTSVEKTFRITVNLPNSPPTAASQSVDADEEVAKTITLAADDPDGDAVSAFTISDQPDNGTLGPIGSIACDGQTPNHCTADVTYTADKDYNGPDQFEFTASDAQATGQPATVGITVQAVDDLPVAADDSATVDEDSEPSAIDVLSNDTDVDGGPKTISSASDPTNGTVVVASNGLDLSYEPDANYCGEDSFTYTLNGGSTATVSVSVTCVDDDPVAVNDTATTAEDSVASAIDVLANDTDIDAGPKTISSASDPDNGTVVLTGGSPGAHTGLTYQPDPNYCNDPPATTLDTFTYTLNGGSQGTVSVEVTCVNDNPVADDESFSGAIGNTSFVVNDPSDGAPDPSGFQKTITGDILDGDTDVDGPGPLAVQAGTFTTNDGGSVTIEADGDFTYVNDPADLCADTSDFFEYTLTDGNSPTAGTDKGRVDVSISGCVWYVSNNASGNSGTSAAPFDTLAQAQTASGIGHTIFVFDGDNTTTGYGAGIDLKANQKLIGEAANLVVGSDTLHTGDATKRPTITDSNADVIALDDSNEVRGVEVDPSGTGGGIAGATGDTGGGTIDDVRIIDSGTLGTQPGLELDATTGTFNISNLTVSSSGATGVRLNNAGTVNFLPAGTISITTSGAKGLDATGTAATPTNMGTGSVFDDITVTGSGTGGVSMSGTTGTTTFGDGTGPADPDLNLTTTSGTAPAFNLSNAGTVAVGSAGVDNVSANGGPAIDVTGTPGASLAFDDVDSTGSSTAGGASGDGINLDGLGSGTFSATSGDIGGAAGIAFDLNGGSGNVTYPGSLNDGPGQTARITGRSGGAVTLSGQIADGIDSGGGISMSANTGGSTTFGGSSKVLNTGSQAAFSSTGSNHTIDFTNGGLDIDTTSGAGFSATGGGTVSVGTGTNPNTIDSTSATALNVANTTIGSGGATFQRISSGNSTAAADPANGIVLSNTGTSGGLTVTGNGGTCTNANTSGCSGGVIQNSTGADNSGTTPPGTGIVLNSTRGVSLTRMHIHDHQNYGIRGTSVTGFTLADSVLNGTNGTSDVTNIRDSSVRFVNLGGTVSVTNNDISGGYTSNFTIDNDSGALSSTFTGNDFGSVSTAGGDDSLHVIGIGTSDLDATVQTNTFNSARGDIFQYAGNGTLGGDLAFTGNTVTNTHPAIATGGGGITISGGAAGPVSINVSNNSMRDALTNALTIVKSDGAAGSMTGTINNNQIGDFTVPLDQNAGSREGAGIEVTHFGGGNATFNITNNQIRQYNSFGMSLVAGAGIASSGQFNFNISGNTLSNPGNNPNITLFQGIGVNSGVTPGDTFQTCVNFGANSIAGSGSSSITDSDFRMRARQNTTVRLPGYAGGPTDTAAVVAFAESKIGGGAQGTAAAFDSGTFLGTGTTCP